MTNKDLLEYLSNLFTAIGAVFLGTGIWTGIPCLINWTYNPVVFYINLIGIGSLCIVYLIENNKSNGKK